jgi:O-antigen/teichoic acid export membrane protein
MLRRLLSDNALLAVQYAAASLVPLLLVPHFMRALGPERFGVIAIIAALMGYASVIVQYAFALTGPADLAQREGGRTGREVFLDVLLARMLLLLPILVAGAGALTFVDAAHRALLAIMLALPVAAALNTGWYLQASGRLPALVGLAVIGVAFSLVLGFSQVDVGRPDSRWAAAALAAGPLAFAVGSLAWALVTLPAERGVPSAGRALRALHRGRHVFISQFAAALYSLAGPLVVGAVGGIRAAGLYGAIERVANAVQAGLTLTHTAAYPQLTRLHADPTSARRYARLFTYVIVVYGAAVVGLGVALLVMADPAQRFLFGMVTAETARLLWLAYAWVALGIAGPLVTGYWTASGQQHRILPLTWRVLLVSLPAGVLGASLLGGAGWLLALLAGQCLVLWQTTAAYREILRRAAKSSYRPPPTPPSS